MLMIDMYSRIISFELHYPTVSGQLFKMISATTLLSFCYYICYSKLQLTLSTNRI